MRRSALLRTPPSLGDSTAPSPPPLFAAAADVVVVDVIVAIIVGVVDCTDAGDCRPTKRCWRRIVSPETQLFDAPRGNVSAPLLFNEVGVVGVVVAIELDDEASFDEAAT